MLEFIQKRFQTAVLTLIVAVLSLVFVLSFNGPGSTNTTESVGWAARVHGATITEGEFRAAYVLGNFQRMDVERARTMRLREHTVDGLVERELLAHEAERMGFTADATDVLSEIAESGVILSSPPIAAPPGYPGPEFRYDFSDRDGRFSSKNMRNFIQNYLRRSIEEFGRWQVRERLAQLARDSAASAVTVSPREVRDEYERETERAQISYARFSPTYYRDRVDASDAAVRAWMGEHESEVDEEYERQQHRYTGLELQVRARHILIKAAETDPQERRDAARARATELLRRARGGEDFAALATEHSEDTGSARRGGDLGWNPRGRMVAAFDEAQFSIEPGSVGEELVESTYGYHIIRVEGRREGDVDRDEAERELAEGLFRRASAGTLAREEAARALAYLRDGHTTAELDERLLRGWDAPPAPAPVEGEEAPEAPERDALAPQVRESRSFGRGETPVSGPFDAGPLAQAAFERSLDEPLPDAPIQLGDDFFVFQLIARTEATDEGFTDEVRARIEERLLADKRAEAVQVWVAQLREQARAEGALRVNDAIFDYGDRSEDDEEGDEEGEEGDEERPTPPPEEEEEAHRLPREAPRHRAG